MAGMNDASFVQFLAVPAVCLLIAFLGYFPQFLFQYSFLEPGPPSRTEVIVFNALLLSLWYTYFKTVTEDPGRYFFSQPATVKAKHSAWCRKCSAPKPARAHHCRQCRRCIPKMDHHCPWTANCVSMTTFPHFVRFLLYANISLWMLGNLLWKRLYALWEARHLPAYLGPTLSALIGLTFSSLICLFTSIALGIMFITTIKGWLFNCTLIEGWQLERHEAVIDRGGRDWWEIRGPDGENLRVEKVEFPYDIGIFANMSQAMGTSNILLWFLPFSSSPTISIHGKGCGWEWEENGFNREEGMWPPLDPEKLRRANRGWPAARRDFAAELRNAEASPEDRKFGFEERQKRDAKTRGCIPTEVEVVVHYDSEGEHGQHGDLDEIASWRNDDGERLQDYGVDEAAERYISELTSEEDEMPIANLVRRRHAARHEEDRPVEYTKYVKGGRK